MKNSCIWGIKILLLPALLYSGQAFAVSEAGEIQRKEQKTPHAEMNVAHNITNIQFAEDSNIAGQNAVNFSADELTNDENSGLITASGDVEIEYNNMRLKTDKLIYDQNKDVVTANGNVRLYSSDGSIVYSDEVVLSEQMTTGEMHHIKVLLKDKSHVFAESFKKKNNQKKQLAYATYTPCDMCDTQSPLWSISARKVQHDEKSQNVHYNDAVIKIKNVPVFYTPFFSHPDPSVKRRSGFLAPSMGSSNYLGTVIQPRYFWAVNDQTNVVFSPIYSSDRGMVWGGSYQQYFYSADTEIAGSYMKDGKEDRPQHRGNVFAKGRYDINDLWRFKYDWKYVSDYLYLKELSLPYQDDAWLTSSAAFERFSGRDYASVEAYYYKILSYNLRRSNDRQFNEINNRKPTVAPLVDVEMYSDPSSIGSYFKNEFNSASVYHQDGRNTQRLTSINAWELPFTSSFGEKYRLVGSVKSDAYYVNRYQYQQNNRYSGTVTRFFPQAGVEWRLPFVKATESSRQIIEPVVVGVVAPKGGNKADKIPNEDSEDVYFDDTNVLDLDRYAGYDRNDTGSRVSYGLRWSSYGDIIGRTSAFIAQSYERDRDSNFTRSLDENYDSNFSDYVGRINAEPNEYLNLNYRFRLDKDSLDAKYSELGVGAGPDFLRAYASYIFLQGNTYYNQLYSERKELYTSLSSALSQFWSVSIYNLQDLTENSRGSLEHGGNVIYEDECLKWVTSVKKYNSSNPDLKNSYEFGTTFYLKTIGSFGS